MNDLINTRQRYALWSAYVATLTMQRTLLSLQETLLHRMSGVMPELSADTSDFSKTLATYEGWVKKISDMASQPRTESISDLMSQTMNLWQDNLEMIQNQIGDKHWNSLNDSKPKC